MATKSGVMARRDNDVWPLIGEGAAGASDAKFVDGVGIVELYAALKQGQSVKQWYSEHSSMLANIDVRRFITFGIIKGFLYRVHKYAYATGSGRAANATKTSGNSSGHGETLPAASMSSEMRFSDDEDGYSEKDEDEFVDEKTLSRYLDGTHCFDQICTELEISERKLTARLKRYPGEVQIIHR